MNADPALDVAFTPVERGPSGSIVAFQPLRARILETTTARHLIATTTT